MRLLDELCRPDANRTCVAIIRMWGKRPIAVSRVAGSRKWSRVVVRTAEAMRHVDVFVCGAHAAQLLAMPLMRGGG